MAHRRSELDNKMTVREQQESVPDSCTWAVCGRGASNRQRLSFMEIWDRGPMSLIHGLLAWTKSTEYYWLLTLNLWPLAIQRSLTMHSYSTLILIFIPLGVTPQPLLVYMTELGHAFSFFLLLPSPWTITLPFSFQMWPCICLRISHWTREWERQLIVLSALQSHQLRYGKWTYYRA